MKTLTVFITLAILVISNCGYSQNKSNHPVVGMNSSTAVIKGNSLTVNYSQQSMVVESQKKLDANNLSIWFWNNGTFNREPITNNAGFEWPKGTGKTAKYCTGLIIGARVESDTLLMSNQYVSECYPGYTDNNGNPQGKDDPAYRVYKLNYNFNDSDRQNWPNSLLGNSDQGAPVYFDNQSQTWKPDDFGDQTLFCAYTDSYPESHINYSGRTMPLKADIKMVSWSFYAGAEMSNISYSEFTIINRSNKVWNSTYICVWSDDDLGNATDDKEGADTNYSMAYTYNSTNYDYVYGTPPPAVGMVSIVSPYIYTSNNNDTVIICRGKYRIVKPKYKQTGMHSVVIYADDSYEPNNFRQAYRVASGLDTSGNSWINPVTGLPTRYFYSGDPVENTGWLDPMASDMRFWQGYGPIDMNPGDTEIIVVAQIIAKGSSNLNSITLLRQYAQIAYDNYFNCFENVPIGIRNNNGTPYTFRLEQNYPNPFNPVTTIKFDIPSNVKWQTSNVKLVIYDVLGKKVAVLVNEKLKPGNYEVEWDGSNFASGVYFYKLETGDFVMTKKMVLLK